MAAQTRKSPVAVKDAFLQRPQAFSFIQAVRLLKQISNETSGKALETFFQETIRVRPELSLGFPSSDVCGLEQEQDGSRTRYRLTASFLGLYGASSPLPTFYTEDLFEEAREDHSGLRDFLDIFNNPFFIKLYKAWGRHRLAVRIVEEKDEEALERLFCLIGLGHESLRNRFSESYQALRYAGLYSQHPRSALGLQTVLADRLGNIPVDIDQCLPQTLLVPQDQRTLLGQQASALGDDTVLGSEIQDSMNKIGIRIGPLNADEFQRLLPGTKDYQSLEEHIQLFCTHHLTYDVSLTIQAGEYRTAVLGNGQWSKLGQDTWLLNGPSNDPGTVSFGQKTA